MPRLVSILVLVLAAARAASASQQLPADPGTAAAAQSPAGAVEELGLTVSIADGAWRRPDDPIRLSLSRPLPAAHRLAVFVGSTDWTDVFAVSEAGLVLRPGPLRLPSGETTLTVYVVSRTNEWQQVAQWPLRVLTPAGFVREQVLPKVDIVNKGQVAEAHQPATNAPPRETFQDVLANIGLQTAHTTVRGVTMTTQVNLLGASFEGERLRFVQEGSEAPAFDLSDYLVAVEGRRGRVSLGHVELSPHRYLMNAFASRGLVGTVKRGALDVIATALNGTAIVGWDNLVGFADRDHQVLFASVGAELAPSRPGTARIEVSFLDGSLLPRTGFTENLVNDAEKSRGSGVRLLASTPGQRLRVDAGAARMRFTNPQDPLLDQGVATVTVRDRTSDARYVDASVDVLRRPVAGGIALLTGTYRHERVDPLYRSVAAVQSVRPDLLLHTAEISGGVGQLLGQVAYTWSHDNLDDIASILTTDTRNLIVNAAAPLPSLARDPARAQWLPVITYNLTRMRQAGDGIPINGGFDSLSQVPDQMNTNHVLRVDWTGQVWRAGYALNHSFQDNRQIGRVQADLGNSVHALTLGFMRGTTLDVVVDVGLERADNRELSQVTRTRRTGAIGNWRPSPRSTVTGTITRTATRLTSVSDDAITEYSVQFAQSIPLPGPAGARPRAQVFVRYMRQTGDLLNLLFGIDEAKRSWSLNTGVTISVFQGVAR